MAQKKRKSKKDYINRTFRITEAELEQMEALSVKALGYRNRSELLSLWISKLANSELMDTSSMEVVNIEEMKAEIGDLRIYLKEKLEDISRLYSDIDELLKLRKEFSVKINENG